MTTSPLPSSWPPGKGIFEDSQTVWNRESQSWIEVEPVDEDEVDDVFICDTCGYERTIECYVEDAGCCIYCLQEIDHAV